MRTLRLYLWKEWRDHRAVVLGIAIAVPLLLLLATFLMPRKTREDPLFTAVGALGAFAMVALSLAGDLIPGETRRETMGFLRRLPSDLGAAFAAKLVFLALALVLLTAWGFGVAGLIGTFPEKLDPRTAFLLPVVGLVAWLFAVSSWLPRGALALPASLLLLGLLGLPGYLLYDRAIGFVPRPPEIIAFTLVVAIAALPVAWLSFVRGYRFGRGPLSAAWRGLVLSLVLAAPVWAYIGHGAVEWRRIDPLSQDCYFGSGVLAEGRRFAYVNARREKGPNHVLRLDLEGGTWNEVGGIGDSLACVSQKRPQSQVFVYEVGSLSSDGKVWTRALDARTGEFRKAAWSASGLPWCVQPEGLPEGWRVVGAAGLGWRVMHGKDMGFFDPFRNRVFRDEDLPRRYWPSIRPGAWIVRTRTDLELLDPESGETRPVVGIAPHSFAQLDPQGRVIVTDKKRGETACVDPETGERVVLGPFQYVACFDAQQGIFGLQRKDGRYVPARLRGDRFEMAEDAASMVCQPIALLEDGSLVFLQDWRRIVVAYFNGKPSEVLWPR